MLNTAAVALVGTVVPPPVTWTTTSRPAPSRADPPSPVRVSTSRLGVIGVNVVAVGDGANPAGVATDNSYAPSDP